jgi:hypothetical protein
LEPCDNSIEIIDQNRICKSELGDCSGNLFDLLLGMCMRVVPLSIVSRDKVAVEAIAGVAITALEIVASICDAGTRVTEPTDLSISTNAGRDVELWPPTGVNQRHPMASIIKPQHQR